MAAGLRVEGHNFTHPILYDGIDDLYDSIPELAGVMCVHATMNQPPQLQNYTVKNMTVASYYSVGCCSYSYCSHNFTDATSYFILDVCRSGGCLFPSLKVEHTACSVPTIYIALTAACIL